MQTATRFTSTAEALRRSEDTVQALLDATTETALLVDTDGRIVALNQTAYQRLGHVAQAPLGSAPDSLIGRCVFDLFPPELARTRRARNDAVIRSAVPSRFEDERNGRWMDNSIYPILDENGNVVRLAIFSYDITERKWTELALKRALRQEQERARRDPLTGVFNHGAIVEELDRLLRLDSGSASHGIAMVDVDGLKNANDTYGHRLGDAILVAVAEALQCNRAVVGRYGGDEFISIIPAAGHPEAETYRRKVLERLSATEVSDEASGVTILVSASIGIAVHPHDHDTVHRLIELADERMYAVKRQRPVMRPRMAA